MRWICQFRALIENTILEEIMEKVLFKSGLHMTNRVLSLFTHLQKKNIDLRLEALLSQPGLAISYGNSGLEDDLQIIDAGGGSIQVKAGIAVFSDYEAAELDADSDSIAITDDSAVYTVLITRADYEKEVGTVAVTTGSLTIAGTSTLFDDEFDVGERFMIDATNAANQVPLIIASIASNVSMTVKAIDGNGDPVALVNEATLDFWSIGWFANGLPSGGDDENIRNHDQITIVVTLAPGGYSPSIVLGTVARTGAALTIVDQREASLMSNKSSDPLIDRTGSENQGDVPAPEIVRGGFVWIEAVTNGVNVVLLDSSMDWRDRIVAITGYMSPNTATPANYLTGTGSYVGGSISINSDGAVDTNGSFNFISALIYSEDGGDAYYACFSNSTGGNPGSPVGIYVDDGSDFNPGDLVMKKYAGLYDEHAIVIKVAYSPKQNHF